MSNILNDAIRNFERELNKSQIQKSYFVNWLHVVKDMLEDSNLDFYSLGIYAHNPLVEFYKRNNLVIERVSPLPPLSGIYSKDKGLDIKDIAILFDYVMYQNKFDQGEYSQILHLSTYRKHVGQWVCCNVPIYIDLDSCKQEMINMCSIEAEVDKIREEKCLPPIGDERRHNFIDDSFTWVVSDEGINVYSKLNGTGHIISNECRALRSALQKAGVTDSNLLSEQTIELFIYNRYINSYYLTQLFFGYHGQFPSLARIGAFAKYTYSTGPQVNPDGPRSIFHYSKIPDGYELGVVSSSPVNVYIVVVDDVDVLSKGTSVLNTYLSDYIESCAGAKWEKLGKRMLRIQQVDEFGQSLFINTNCIAMGFNDDLSSQLNDELENAIQNIEDSLTVEGIQSPYIMLVSKDGALMSEVIWHTYKVSQLSGLTYADLGEKCVPIRYMSV